MLKKMSAEIFVDAPDSYVAFPFLVLTSELFKAKTISLFDVMKGMFRFFYY